MFKIINTETFMGKRIRIISATAREPVRPRVWDCGCLLRVHPHKHGGGRTPALVCSPGNRSGTSLVDGSRTAQSLVYAAEHRHVFLPLPSHVLLRHRTMHNISYYYYCLGAYDNILPYWQARNKTILIFKFSHLGYTVILWSRVFDCLYKIIIKIIILL